jgi:propionyl-CoA carboxylase beta chain
MNSRDLGAHVYLAWTGAELGIMGPEAAVDIIHRRDLAAASDPVHARSEFAKNYRAQHLTAEAAATHGYVDEVITPNETRPRLISALRMLAKKTGARGNVRNIPL